MCLTGRVLLPEGELYPLKPEYADCVAHAGGVPVVVRCGGPLPRAADFDALLLCGGVDIDPSFYGQRPLPDARLEIDAARDALEFALLEAFIAAGKPVYGICRGIQLINAALGGLLWQDLPSQQNLVHSAPDAEPALYHDVFMEDGRVLNVNSLHHQGIRTLGRDLVCVGRSADGLAEAIRHATLPIGAVQWHPERMGHDAFSVLDEIMKPT